MLRGEALYQLDRYEEGAEAARRGLELEPEDVGPARRARAEPDRARRPRRRGAGAALRARRSGPRTTPCSATTRSPAHAAASRQGRAARRTRRAARPGVVDVLRARAQVAQLNGRPQRAKHTSTSCSRSSRTTASATCCAATSSPRATSTARFGTSSTRRDSIRPTTTSRTSPATTGRSRTGPVADLPDPALRAAEGLGRVPRPACCS